MNADHLVGTSDEHLSIVTYLKAAKISGAVVITTPQEVALMDVRKEINFCKKVGVPIIGVVENMSGFVCPNCKVRIHKQTFVLLIFEKKNQKESQIFPPTTGGAEKMAREMDIPFLGRVPLDPRIARACDEGKFYLSQYPESEATTAFKRVFEGTRDWLFFSSHHFPRDQGLL